MIAAILNTITKAYFLFFLRKTGVTIPTFVRKYISIGNSKINPEARTEALTSPI